MYSQIDYSFLTGNRIILALNFRLSNASELLPFFFSQSHQASNLAVFFSYLSLFIFFPLNSV